MGWVMFLTGMMIGGMMGMLISAVLGASRREDELMEELYDRRDKNAEEGRYQD